MRSAYDKLREDPVLRVGRAGKHAALAAAAAAASIGLIILGFTADKIYALAVVGLLGLAAGLVLSGNPRLFCLWGLLLAAPIDMGKKFMPVPHMGGASAFRVELVDVFMGALIVYILRDVWMRRVSGVRIPRSLWWWIGMMGLGCMTIGLGPYRISAAQEVFRMGKCLVLALVVINEVVRVRQFTHAFMALMVGVLLQCAVGTLQYVLDRQLGLQAIGEATAEGVELLSKATLKGGERVNRVGALIGHANLLAAYLAMLLPIGIAVVFARVSPLVKGLCLVTLVLGEGVLLLTLSRTGWVDFGVALLLVLALSHYHRRMRLRYVLVRMAIIAAIAMVGVAFSGPILDRINKSDPGAWKFRLEWIEVAFRMVQAKPVFGFGLNSFVFQMVPYTPQGSPEELNLKFGELWPVVHNIYMVVWAEQGTVGLLLFLGLHVHVGLVAIRNLRIKNDLMFAMSSGCFCGFVAVAIDGMGSFALRMDHVARVFWLLVAIIVAIDYWRRANEEPVELAARASRGTGSLTLGRFAEGPRQDDDGGAQP